MRCYKWTELYGEPVCIDARYIEVLDVEFTQSCAKRVTQTSHVEKDLVDDKTLLALTL
jgi:hypothetical protein